MKREHRFKIHFEGDDVQWFECLDACPEEERQTTATEEDGELEPGSALICSCHEDARDMMPDRLFGVLPVVIAWDSIDSLSIDPEQGVRAE